MKGLTKELVLELSEKKREPEWMRDLRLRALSAYKEMSEPDFGPDITEVSRADIRPYIEPETEMVSSWEEVPADIRETFEKLGIPEAEREGLAGVGAQYDSETVYHNLKTEMGKLGVVYLPMEEAVRDAKWGEVVREHFMKLVHACDHKYAALHAAVWSGGSFVYVPKGVAVEMPLQSYYRLNAPGAGQFEHTLIIVDEGADLHFIEGCSAPKMSMMNLHAGCVELYVQKNAHLKYSTVESWSKNMFNLNTKRALVAEGATMEWVTGSFGSGVSMLYPCAVLSGRGARMEYTGVSFAGAGQKFDTGAKVIHLAPETCSFITSKSLAKDGGENMYRSLVKIMPEARGSKSFADCSSLMLDSESRADTVPVLDVRCSSAEVAHEASVGRIADAELEYLASRGVTEARARAMIVRGFTGEVSNELPLEYAMEMNNLIRLEMEGQS